MKTNNKRVIGLIAAASLFTMSGFAMAKEITLGLSVDQLFESRVAVIDAIKAEAEQKGYKIIEVVADGDAQAQNSQIQSLVTQKVDAILVCAVDQNTIERALIGAKRRGIPIVAYDRALPDSRAVDAYVGPDSITDGYLAGQYTAEQFKDTDEKIVILELLGALNDQNGIDRSKGFNDALKGLKNVEVIAMPTDWDSARALAATQNAFQANPNIKAVFAATDTHIPSVETVLRDLNKIQPKGSADHVVVTGVNGSNDGYQATLSGNADGIVAMDTNGTGIKTVKVATALINGEPVDMNNVIPGNFYTTDDIEANKSVIWGAK
ncbi:sugar ABC transporter substrate-binding protein [Vibrio sp. WXL210]|uniref:sugar ABC transporter substrate-binding protein n=1 Tax=Vibrio sp. WXL210 TaxID=3450709 RepID=UPI003EC80595